MDKHVLLKTLKLIEGDMESDVRNFEGQAFTGKNVAIQLGNQAAAISALANIVRKVVEEAKDD